MVSMILILSIGALSFVLFRYAEASVVAGTTNEMKYLSSLKSSEIESLHNKASEDILFAVKNPVFINYFELPESKHLTFNADGVVQFSDRQRQLKSEMEQWISYFQSQFKVDETCVVDITGQEHARLVLGEIAPDTELSSEEAQTPFFKPTLQLSEGQVHIEKPYVSPDTNRYVFAYATPIVLPDGSKPGFFHFEMPINIFQKLVETDRGRMYVVDTEGHLIADSGTEFNNKPISEELDKDFPSITSISKSESFSAILPKIYAYPGNSEVMSDNYVDDHGEMHFITYSELPPFGWHLIYDIPYSQLLNGDTSLDSLKTLTATTAIIVAGVAVLIAAVVSDKIVAAIKRIADLCKGQTAGNLRPIETDTKDELGSIVSALNNLIGRISENESRLVSANEELKKLDKMKDEFVSIASHELRTPIQPIMSYAELGKAGVMKPERAFDEIKKQAQRLKRLASDILDASKIEGGRIQLLKENVSINEIVSDNVNAARIGLGTSELVKIELMLGTPDSLVINADKSRMNQVLGNLIGNAIKFTKEGIINIETRLSSKGNVVEVIISDNGPGINEEVLPRLFEKFASKNGPNTGNEGGTGLGLYISKAIIEAHGGSIDGSNREDRQGAKFTLLLPVVNPKIQVGLS